MKRRFQRRLGMGLGAFLAGVILLELVLGGPGAEMSRKASAGTKIGGPVAAMTGPNTQANVATILSRPLFETGRRFPVIASAPAPIAKEDKPKQLRLMGVVVISSARLALFQVEGNDKPVLAAAGEQVAGSTIERISRGSVLLHGSGGVYSLTPMAQPSGEAKPDVKSEPDPPS